MATATSSPLLPGLCSTPLSEVFFGRDNIDALQHGLRYGVFVQSGESKVIGRQSDDELLIVMRSVFLQHAKNAPGDPMCQVRALNRLVLEFCVPRVVAEVAQYEKHLAELDVNPVPVLARAINVSQKGTRVLQSQEW